MTELLIITHIYYYFTYIFMKKKISLTLIVVLLLFFGYIYLQNQENYDLEWAKQDLRNWNTNETVNAWDQYDTATQEPVQELSPIIIEWKNYIIERITKNQSLEINAERLSNSDFSWEKRIDIVGTVWNDVEKINVKFFNSDSEFPDDDYDLNTYTQWNGEFKYVASPEFKVLDSGENIYIFTATGKEGESVTKLTIKTNEKEENEEKKTQEPSEELESVVFPKWDFGEAIMLDNESAYYSDIKGLEIQKRGGLSDVICEAPDISETTGSGTSTDATEQTHSITSFLLDSYSSWVYWNTCRPTTKDLWISFYVLRLLGDDEFKYEKHYLDYNNELHGILELKTGTGVTKDNIWEKNREFKDENFEITNISDALFQEIILENRS